MIKVLIRMFTLVSSIQVYCDGSRVMTWTFTELELYEKKSRKKEVSVPMTKKFNSAEDSL